MWTRNSSRIGWALTGTVVLLGLSGCQEGSSVVSETKTYGTASLNEQRNWVVGEIVSVIAATGTENRWRGTETSAPRWDEERDSILESSRKVRCSFEPDRPNPAGLMVDLWSDPLEQDPFELAERVRRLWESEGWKISDIVRKGDTAASNEVYFRADRADGSEMSLDAVDDKGGKLLLLSVQAACSSDPTVAW